LITTSSLIIIKSVIIVQTIFFWLIQGYIIAPKTLFINEQYVCVLYYYVDNDLTCLPTVIEEKKNPPYILTSFCLFFFVLSLFIRPFYTFSLSLFLVSSRWCWPCERIVCTRTVDVQIKIRRLPYSLLRRTHLLSTKRYTKKNQRSEIDNDR
jgi:hypothetical protein